MTSTTASAIRPSLRDNRQLSGSPHTPSRFISSNFSSPGSSFRQEEDAIIIDLDPRSLKAGYEGESGPQCVLPFGPENARRVGDYRTWLPDYKRPYRDAAEEAEDYALWRNDLKDFDLGLMEDKLERAVREVYNKYLLTDAGTSRLVLVLPSLVPLAVLSSILTTLFERWKYTSITMLPTPTMCTLAAGLRSSLVVDIGWEETVVTPVYEYRELTPRRSTRGMKRLVQVMAEKLRSLAKQQTLPDGESLRQDFDFVEEFVTRMAACKLLDAADEPLIEPSREVKLFTPISFDWPCHSTTQTVTMPRDEIFAALNDTFFGIQNEVCHDDDEQPLGQLVYQTLLRLPPDIRGICMSRVAFSGRGHAITGLSNRIMEEVKVLTVNHSWDEVRGQKVKPLRQGLDEIAQARTAPADFKHNTSLPIGNDFVEEKLFKHNVEGPQLGPQGVLRAVDTLGAWVGASLLSSLKIKGVVEVDRERFLSHGFAGASREQEVGAMPQRTTTFGVGATKSSDKTSWTLAGWA